MRGKKIDKNQPQIIADLRKCGCIVEDVHEAGDGFPDLVVSYKKLIFIVEVKNPEENWKLTEKEKEFFLRWRDNPLALIIETTEEFFRLADKAIIYLLSLDK